MDFNKIKLLINTIIHLRAIQIYYRIYYFLRNRLFGYNVKKRIVNDFTLIVWENRIDYDNSYFKKENSFTFLNIPHSFSDKINWNINQFGKLWTYNLNYFDFLNQENISKETGLHLIQDFIKNDALLKDGKEPYPISLRGINWVKFLSNNQVKDELINNTLYFHYCILFKNLEYHLLGNHLLENAFSLLFGAYYFQDEKLYNNSKDLLISELNEQVLKDGAHFELSPMYHQIILSRLLDGVQLIKLNSEWKKDDLLSFLEVKASLMISWLHNITYKNGNIPMLNDATFNIAPNSENIFSYAKHLGINSQNIPLSDSGYRKIKLNNYELLLDIGNVGPDYQPGHAHSDTFNFELIIDDNPVIVDTGISTYEKNTIRQYERATSSHNTVKIGFKEQTQVWGGFRVAKRAKITHLIEKPNLIEASHDGYLSDGYKHTRSFMWGEKYLILKDKINRSTSNNAKAYFHLHSSVTKPLVDGNTIMLESSGVSIEFERASTIYVEEYQLSAGFNKTNLAYKIVVLFDQILKTKISL
ncbi:heparinase II/III family protein [Flavobacteriaceae bacterium]|nr:heparinase II/III family protein [Flavobacteriaceae bacterium]